MLLIVLFIIFLSYVLIVSIILFLKEFKFSQTILLVIASCLSFRFTLWKKFSMGFRSGDLGEKSKIFVVLGLHFEFANL